MVSSTQKPPGDSGDDDTQRLLKGYNVLQWPDLSAERAPPDYIHTSDHELPRAQNGTQLGGALSRVAVLLAATGRVLGVYCGISDVILAAVLEKRVDPIFLRVAWDHGQTWSDVVRTVEQSLRRRLERPLSLTTIRRILDMGEKQYPCMALCSFTPNETDSAPDYPLVFTFNSEESKISLSASLAHLHPSVSRQLISQLSVLFRHAVVDPLSPMALIPRLPSELMSAYDRTDEEGLRMAYPHLPPVLIATDYLSRRAKINSLSTAVRWFPDLSMEGSIDGLNSESITYGDLNAQANQLARWLLTIGLQKDDRVAVCMHRNLQFHVAMFGIMKAGGCYVPIDPELPVERKSFIAKDSNARFVFTTADVSSPSLFGSPTVFVEKHESQTAIGSHSKSDIDVASPDGLAFLLYTSGTTGTPKGCLLTHRGLSQAIIALSSTAADVRMEDIRQGHYLAVASVAFDVHLAETFVPLALGMPLLSAPRSQLLENLPFHIKRLRITHVGIVPSLIEATMGTVEEDGGTTDLALRYIASGGEKMSNTILEKWADHPQVRLANFYGPSEVTIGCCGRFMDSRTSRANIGRPFANVSGYVVDANLNILPRGGMGELLVEGPLVGRGYHGRPDLTERVFLEFPERGKWAYRTGDLVRMMPDSTLEILGRIDTQIKLRGVRIESEGISSIIRKASPSFSGFYLDATTVLAKHPSIGTEQLVSFVSWDTSIPVSIRKSTKPQIVGVPKALFSKIRAICDEELASYMRPSHLIPLSWLPLNSNGKSDAKVLVEAFMNLQVDILAGLMVQDMGEVSQPVTKLERDVLEIMARYTSMPLDVPHPHINVFECGMDSMAIIRFAADLKVSFGHKVSASDIMKAPTLASIASFLETPSAPNSSEISTSYVRRFSNDWMDDVKSTYLAESFEDIAPPFSVQEGVLSRSADNDTMYVQHVIVQSKSSTSLSGLWDAWHAVLARHPILRTVFHFSRALVQVVLRQGAHELPWTEKPTQFTDGQTFSNWFLREEASTVAKDINQTLSVTPPLRIGVYVSSKASFIVLSIHHALFDGISLPILLNEIEREYAGSAPYPPALLGDILDQIGTIDMIKAQSFWADYFDGFVWPSKSLQTAASSATRRHVVPFKTSLSNLKTLAAGHQVTLQALLTCTFGHILATHIYRSDDVAFGVIRSGRLLPVDNVETAMCPMISVLPMRVNFLSPGDVLQIVQSTISSVVELEHVPLGKVQSWVRPGKPLFETLFSVSMKDTTQSAIWDVVESEPPQADYILSVEVVIDPEYDSLVVQAAWVDGDLSSAVIGHFTDGFESFALETGERNRPRSMFTSHTNDFETIPEPNDDSEEDPEAVANPDLMIHLRDIVSGFFTIDQGLLTDATSFISLGLDSIKSVGLARALRKQGHNIAAVELMKASTLRRLAVHLASGKSSPTKDSEKNSTLSQALQNIRNALPAERLKLSPDDDVQLFPTTTLQAGMLSQTVNSEGDLYVHAFPLQLSGEVDINRLRGAWDRTMKTISILRTTFHLISDLGLWAQAVHSSNFLEWSVDTFQSADDYRGKLALFISSIRLDEKSFERPPIWVRIIRPAPQSTDHISRMVIVMHHALYDGVSIAKLLDAVKTIYRTGELDPPTQFTDLLGNFTLQEEGGTPFWVRSLRGYHPTQLPPRPDYNTPITSYTASQIIVLDSVLVSNVLRRTAVTLQCLGQAVWAKLLGSITGTLDVVFGHIISGRSMPGAEDVIGPVLNTIPCRIQLQRDVQNIELLRSIHQANVAALPWQQASLRSVHRELGVSRLWDSLFLFQPYEEVTDSDPLWSFDALDEPEVKIQYPFNIEMHQNASGVIINAACRSDYMGLEELTGLLRRFQHLLENLIAQPNALALADVPELLNTAQRQVDAEGILSTPLQQQGQVPAAISSLLVSITKVSADRITLQTPLAALGIDSITAIQMVSRFKEAGMRLVTSDIVSSRTAGDLVDKIEMIVNGDAPTKEKKTLIELPAHEKDAILARFSESAASIERITIATSGMKWLIGSWQRSEGSRFQHAFAYKLPIDIDIERLKGAWGMLLQRHSLLRSTFGCASGGPEPRIVTFKEAQGNTWADEHLDDESFLESAVARMHTLVSNCPPTTTSLARALVLQSSRERWLVLHLHHFQFDAWTLPLYLDDLSLLYRGSKPAASNDIDSLLHAYAPNSENLASQKQYWQRVFPSHFQPVLFPSLTKPSGDALVNTQKRSIYTNEAAISGAALCEERARSLQVSLQAVLLACWSSVQAKHSSSGSSTFALWQAGRMAPVDDIAKLAVPCTNILPMHVPSLRAEDIIGIAKNIQGDLRTRSAVIQQSDLVQVHEWVRTGGKALCNVIINIVRIAPDIRGEEELFEPLMLPYFVPDVPPVELNATIDRLAVTEFIQDDLALDIATIESKDTILMSIDAGAHIINVDQAKMLVEEWAQAVLVALGISTQP